MPQKTYWINGKKHISDRDLTNEELESLAGPQMRATPPKTLGGTLSGVWDTLNTPLTDMPSRIGQSLSNAIPEGDEFLQSANDLVPGFGGVGLGNLLSYGKGLLKGGLEGAGEVGTQMTTPANIIPTLAGMGEVGAIRTAMGAAKSAQQAAAAARTARSLGLARQITSAPAAVEGGINLVHGESTPMERLMAVPQLAGGLGGVMAPRFGGNVSWNPPPMEDLGNVPPPRPPSRAIPPPQQFLEGDILSGPLDTPMGPPTPPGFGLDPRINSMNLEQAPPVEMPPSGIAGPVSRGYLAPEITQPNMIPELPIQNRAIPSNLDPTGINGALSELAQRRAARPPEAEILAEPELVGTPSSGEVIEFDPLVTQLKKISSEMDPEIIRDNYNNAQQELEWSKLHGTADDIETAGTLRDEALDRLRSIERIDPKPMSPLQRTLDTIKAAKQPSLADIEPQEMRVPGVKGPSGLENVAMGGADPRVLDVLGSSLYSGSRPVISTKELLQNAFDEHRISGQTKPIKVYFDNKSKNPVTGTDTRAVSIADRGRGLKPEEIYTVLTDVGKTGKGNEPGASGGFGFAKAAPFLGGEYVEVRSVVNEGGKKVEYTFQGNPTELKNQGRGVPLNRKEIDQNMPTGMKITTHFPPDETFYSAEQFAKNLTQMSGNITSPIKMRQNYGSDKPSEKDLFLHTDDSQNYLETSADVIQSQGLPPLQGTVETPGASVNIHYEPPLKGDESSSYRQHMMNKGLYQQTGHQPYGSSLSNVPKNIVTDIIAKVEEGSADYPFTANREQLDHKVTEAIDTWISENVIKGAVKSRIADLKKSYDSIQPLPGGSFASYYDESGSLTPDELKRFGRTQAFTKAIDIVQEIFDEALFKADSFNWTPEFDTKTDSPFKPSERIKKFGILFQAGSEKGTTLGIHIPDPANLDDSAILINVMEHLNRAMSDDNPIDKLATGIWTTLSHEIAHAPGGAHDQGFAYRHAQLLDSIGTKLTTTWLQEIGDAFGDSNTGQINPEIQELLQVYNESRQRKPSSEDTLLRTGVHEFRPPDTGGRTTGNVAGNGPSGSRTRSPGENLESFRAKWNLPRGMMSVDLPYLTSAGLRQGLPWAWSKHWWRAWAEQSKSFHSEDLYKKFMTDLETRPLFKPQVTFRGQGTVPTFGPSLAEQMGLAITDLTKVINRREEVLRGELAEHIPGYGKYVRASNRAYTTFLNHIRASAFEQLMTDMNLWDGRNITNEPLARELADFVNTTTGRGSGKIHIPVRGVGKGGVATVNIDKVMGPLAEVFFSPRLWKSRLDMLNPLTYTTASPPIRKQYIRKFLGMATAWAGILSLLELMGAEVNDDPNSSDYAKARFGNLRIDPGGGFQQNIVMANRMLQPEGGGILPQTGFGPLDEMVEPAREMFRNIPQTGMTPIDLLTGPSRYGGGGISSPVSNSFNTYGQGYRPETRLSDAIRFTTNKLNPSAKYIADFFGRSERQPFYVIDRTLQLFAPMFSNDLAEVMGEGPIPAIGALGAGSIGMGAQTFEGGPGKPTLTPLLGLEDVDIEYQ